MSRDLLPDHPWLGDPDLRDSGLAIAGATWAVCADMVVEAVDRLPFRRGPIVALRGLASMARRLTVPVTEPVRGFVGSASPGEFGPSRG